MKIRTDFVTNSSSSNFSVLLTITDKNGNEYQYAVNPPNRDYGGTCGFSGRLEYYLLDRVILKVKELCDTSYVLENLTNERNDRIEDISVGDNVKLVKSKEKLKSSSKEQTEVIEVIHEKGSIGILPNKVSSLLGICFDCLDLDARVTNVVPLSRRRKGSKYALCEVEITIKNVNIQNQILTVTTMDELVDKLTNSVFGGGKLQEIDREKFKNNTVSAVSTLSNVSKISARRDYSAYGESADLIPENDRPLRALARKVADSADNDKDQALKEMLNYIQTATGQDRQGERFARNFEDIRYSWTGDKSKLIKLADKLCSNRAIFNEYKGYEFQEIDIENNAYQEYAVFNLDE